MEYLRNIKSSVILRLGRRARERWEEIFFSELNGSRGCEADQRGLYLLFCFVENGFYCGGYPNNPGKR